MSILILDNYDSFTYNLVHLVSEVNQCEALVFANDALSLSQIRELAPQQIIISPGPGRPEVAQDVGICRAAIAELDVPILGICLGHQLIFDHYGGTIARAKKILHGWEDEITHNHEMFAQLGNPFTAVRYHSLSCQQPVPEVLDVIAYSSDDEIMGIAHKSKPVIGLQFHPESILSQFGFELLNNFRLFADRYNDQTGVIGSEGLK